ncbi:MAG: hypothetical protein LBV23_06940, partial [Deltaproteobacteria bacterium]|nr:hypothetical protein [Deltaproteobacteria bacterium]
MILWLTFPYQALADGELVKAMADKEAFLKDVSNQKRSRWLELITQFEKAAEVQPKKEHRAKALFMAADLAFSSWRRFKIKDDAIRTESLAKKSIKSCSRCSEASEATILVGRALLAQDRAEEA